jgi:hypothetical protein
LFKAVKTNKSLNKMKLIYVAQPILCIFSEISFLNIITNKVKQKNNSFY